MKREHDNDKSKQPYEKPGLRIIQLAAEEVLAVGCKLSSGGGHLPVATPCNAIGCSGIGS